MNCRRTAEEAIWLFIIVPYAVVYDWVRNAFTQRGKPA